jgi:hypothetical protein
VTSSSARGTSAPPWKRLGRRGDPGEGPRRGLGRPLSQGGHDSAGVPVHDRVGIHLLVRRTPRPSNSRTTAGSA